MSYKERESGTDQQSGFERLDAFGARVDWLLPGSRRAHRSVIGAICTLIIYATLITYGYHRLYLLVGRNDYQILSETQRHYFDETFYVGGPTTSGFNVAAALT